MFYNPFASSQAAIPNNARKSDCGGHTPPTVTITRGAVRLRYCRPAVHIRRTTIGKAKAGKAQFFLIMIFLPDIMQQTAPYLLPDDGYRGKGQPGDNQPHSG